MQAEEASNPDEHSDHLDIQSTWKVVKRKGNKGRRNRVMAGKEIRGTQRSNGFSGSHKPVTATSSHRGNLPSEECHREKISLSSMNSVANLETGTDSGVVSQHLVPEEARISKEFDQSITGLHAETLTKGSKGEDCNSAVDVDIGALIRDLALSEIGRAHV